MSLTDEKFECFKIDIQDKIAHIILNRPEKMNSLPVSFWSDLPRIINEIDITVVSSLNNAPIKKGLRRYIKETVTGRK